MRIRCLRTGVVRERKGARGLRRYLWAPWRDAALPVNAFLVEHPAGLCLFDAGQTVRATGRGYFPRWQPFFRLARFELDDEDEAVAQLSAFGIRPDAVRWVVLSHLHTDHVGGLAPFSTAEVLVGRTEWERAVGLAGRIRGYLPQYWPDDKEPRLLELDGDGFGPFPASYDLSGDGTLVVVATPGHTRGHLSLLVRRPAGDVLLGGDLAHTAAELERIAPAVARYCSEHDVTYVGAHDWDAEAAVQEGDQAMSAPMLTPDSDSERT
jgi:glyoxylase-like metal-dependent hydrolase (beta-lactamase superfamily II)